MVAAAFPSPWRPKTTAKSCGTKQKDGKKYNKQRKRGQKREFGPLNTHLQDKLPFLFRFTNKRKAKTLMTAVHGFIIRQKSKKVIENM